MGGGSTRLELVLDGERYAVDVDLDRGTCTVGGQVYPVRLLEASGDRLVAEVAGERLEISGWPLGAESPSGPVAVNGELHAIGVERTLESIAPLRPSFEAGRSPPSGSRDDIRRRETASAGPGGRAILPPMPGRVLELRVQEGQTVAAGEVLLVVEAMKMRNEVTSPIAGKVRELRVEPGTNVRTREPMLRVVPD